MNWSRWSTSVTSALPLSRSSRPGARAGAARALGGRRIGGRPRAGDGAPAGRRSGRRVAADQQRRIGAVPATQLARRRIGGAGSQRRLPPWCAGRSAHRPAPCAEPFHAADALERGDVDIARDLTPGLIAALAGNEAIAIDSHPRGTLIYLAANAAHPILGNRLVVHALRHAVDYHGMVESSLAGQFVVHQAFWPSGLWASHSATPYRLNLARARELLAQAGQAKVSWRPGQPVLSIRTPTRTPSPATRITARRQT